MMRSYQQTMMAAVLLTGVSGLAFAEDWQK